MNILKISRTVWRFEELIEDLQRNSKIFYENSKKIEKTLRKFEEYLFEDLGNCQKVRRFVAVRVSLSNCVSLKFDNLRTQIEEMMRFRL